MCAMQTPPEIISNFREFFDNQSESVRRAFYSLGNYLAANNVLKSTEPVIMDRYNVISEIITFSRRSINCHFLFFVFYFL